MGVEAIVDLSYETLPEGEISLAIISGPLLEPGVQTDLDTPAPPRLSRMETYLADVRQLHANPDVTDEAFSQRYAELTNRYPDLLPQGIGKPVEPSPTEPQPVPEASALWPAVLGVLGSTSRKTALVITAASLLAACSGPPTPSIEVTASPPGATIQVTETATPQPAPTETVVPPTHALATEVPTPTEVVIKTIQEQLDAWTTGDLSNESTVETASGTYTFKVAVSGAVAKMGGLPKFVVDDNTQNDAMLYALARLWHWEDKLGGEGRSPDNTFGRFASIDLTDQPQQFIQAMRSVQVRPTTDILNRQTSKFNIIGAIPREEFVGIEAMVMTEDELSQLKDKLQQEGRPFLQADRIPDTFNPKPAELVVYMDAGILHILSFNHNGPDDIGNQVTYSQGLESLTPDIHASKYLNTMNKFNYYRIVNNLFSNPFLPFEEWTDNHNRSWTGQWLLFGIHSNTPPFVNPESTPMLQVEFSEN